MEMAAGFGIFAVLYFVFVAAVAVLGIWIAILVIKVLQLKITELKLRIARYGDEPPRQGGNGE
ncbi:hypothetical protein [Arthrobacter castelli]|uniref:hypothetical protein n=1 Tax=Arthrobacter castelli TaxID=271431 RepID=UPI00041404FD|nr:hypothetical protein [Arthrobacter castelli]